MSSLILVFLFGFASCLAEYRIINGSATDVEKYPFVASLRDNSRSHFCGSSIIAPNWILTAAHCVEGHATRRMTVQYASSRISSNGGNVVGVKRVIIHEHFNGTGLGNDIALLELTHSLLFNNRTLAPVTLPPPYFEIPQTKSGARGLLIGWGRKRNNGHIQKDLQEVHLKIYSDEECRIRHNGSTTSDHICAGVDDGGKGQCKGDSGGPLLYKDSIQLGIVSWSKKRCTVAPYPGVLTKVSHYIDWINSHIT